MNEKEFSVSTALTPDFKQQLIEFTNNDPIIAELTRDLVKRFSSLENLEKWVEKGQEKNPQREFFFLNPSDNPEKLNGIIWFSPSELPDKILEKFEEKFPDKTPPSWTFAIRLYDEARGKGHAMPFMEKAVKKLREKYPNEAIWLSTKNNNEAALHLYEKFGFETLLEDQEEVVWMVFL